MNKIASILLLPLGLSASLLAAPGVVRISGKVVGPAGAPLGGASLSLKGVPGASANSAENGGFLLTSGNSGVGGRAATPGFSLRLEEGGAGLVLSLPATVSSADLEIRAADGRRTFQFPSSTSGGSRRIPASAFGAGVHLVRLRRGDAVVSGSILRVGDRLLRGDFPQIPSDGGGIAARLEAAAVDTLIAAKTGYRERRLPIPAYVDSNLNVAMDSAADGNCPAPKPGTTKSNPLFTDVYTADPAVMVDGCTFYIQAGHDQGTGGFDLREWYLLKSTDMVNWTRTTPMTLKTFAWTNANAWAGQMIKAKNGKYYWYVPINDIKFSKDRMAIGVAVADKPEGPWKDALGKPLINDSLEMATWNIADIDQTPHTIDPTVFIDDDGQAYLQYGGFWTMVTVKLNPDMVSLGGKLVKATPPDYFESPYLIKRNKIYYQIYAHGAANPTTIDYATSASPMGPWTHKGTILGKMPKVAGQDETTNHAGVAEFAGQWYIVYHVSNGPNGGGTYRREVAVDKLFFNADGTIQPVAPSAALTF